MCPPDSSKVRSKRSDAVAPFEAAAPSPKLNRKANGTAAQLPKGGVPVVALTPLSFVVLLLGCAAVSFSVGYLSRNLFLPSQAFSSTMGAWTHATHATQSPSLDVEAKLANLPGIPTDKKVPHNKYTFKQFETSSDVRSNSVLLDGQCEVANDGTCEQPTTTPGTNAVEGADSDDTAQGNGEPSGQHLLVDIENVDATFLNSEYQLANAMIELINLTPMTLLSYHCIGLKPMGVSCVGVLLEGHISFHTWPLEGVITFDLFSSGSNSLVPRLPTIKELFGVPMGEPRMVWGHKLRGFLTTEQSMIQDSDTRWITGIMNLDKEHVATVKTHFQRIDIYDLMEPRFDGRDRVVFLDGIIQSRGYGENAYHEALVHPALFAHDNPRRVVIIGGGEGATLREVLKHNTVQEVYMIEIDKGMVDTSKQYLPEWSYCGNLIGSTDSCFDDPRAKVYYNDAIAWFLERFGPNTTLTDDDLFDVIIMDALDPNSVVEFSDLLYNNDALTDAFGRALGEDGIFIAQVGEAEEIDDPPEYLFPHDHFVSFVNGLQRVGFESIIDYAEEHGRLVEIWSFVLAMKDSDSRTNWLMSEAEMNLKIQKRSVRTKNGESPFLYFDGATMMQYQLSSRVVEDTWCRDKLDECAKGHGFDPEIPNVPRSSFEVKPSVIAKGGRGVFATEFIPKGSQIMLDDCVHGMFIPGTTYDLMDEAAEKFTDKFSEFWDVVYWGYVDGYGWVDSGYGLPTGGVDPGILTFTNHGCNGQYNVGTKLEVNEMTMKPGLGPEGIFDDSNELYHPYWERHFPLWGCNEFVALRDIEAGEELLDNYLVFGGDEDANWESNLQELKKLCSGGTGRITEYEKEAEGEE